DNGLRPQSSLVVPMATMGRIVGTVEVQSYENHAYREEHVTAMKMAANLAAVALENMRLLQFETRAREAAEEASRLKDEFLATLSHELRTPLTSILGFAEILLDHEDLTGSQRRFCEKIQSSGFQLQASLNQLVDLSRLEAGQTELFLHEFSVRETLRESCAAVARLAQKQGVTLDCTPAPSLGGIVSDEGKLRQVLYNFFAFAIGRSPAGGTVHINAAPVEGARVRVEINDEGEPLKEHARLFDPVNVDAPNERGTNMNELGLVIAHRLLTVLGGGVTLHDLTPTGLSVHLNLPARPAGE
ncbi:MAG: ATP-binding protein, partial [Acidobacteriota bacterium]|nr:ATP-binding protein [Acidobacteriota bacterium]